MDPDAKRRVLKVLRQVMRSKHAQKYFNFPVDPDSMGIPEYRDIIKDPMDLGTIVENLQASKYLTSGEVLRDVQLVWDNCQLFNQPGSDVYNASVELSDVFSTTWAKNGLVLEPVASSSQPKPARSQHQRLPARNNTSKQEFDQQKLTFTVRGGAHGRGVHRSRLPQTEMDNQQWRFAGRSSGVKRRLYGQKDEFLASRDGPGGKMGYDSEELTDGAVSGSSEQCGQFSNRVVPGHRLERSAREDSLKIKIGGVGGGRNGQHMEQTETGDFLSMVKQSHPLHRCLLILDAVLQSEEAGVLSRLPHVPSSQSLTTIRERLSPGLTKGWGTIKYKCTTDVLKDVGCCLKSLLVLNKDNEHYSQMCNKVFATIRKSWQEAGLEKDLKQLRASIGQGGSTSHSHTTPPDFSRRGVGDQRPVKIRKKESGGGGRVTEPDPLDLELDAARADMESARDELDRLQQQKSREVERMGEIHRSKQVLLQDLQKKLGNAMKQQEKVMEAVEVAQIAAQSLQEAQGVLQTVIHKQAEKAAAKEAEQQMEVHPEDARIVDPDVFHQHNQKPVAIPGDMMKLGSFWFGLGRSQSKLKERKNGRRHTGEEGGEGVKDRTVHNHLQQIFDM